MILPATFSRIVGSARQFAVRPVIFLFLFVVGFCLTWSPTPPAAQSSRTDLNLVLAIDCSYSVDAAEYALQVRGMAAALIDPAIISAIQRGPNGRIAITVVQWSSSKSQIISVPWTLVSSAAEAQVLAARIGSQPRRTADGGTSISTLIDFAIAYLAKSPYNTDRSVIDVASDGTNNNGGRVDDARDRAAARGIEINGLTILDEIQWLHYYFYNHVVTGPGAFVVIANDYAAYVHAIRKKLLKEILGPRMS